MSGRKFSVKRNLCKACEKSVYDNEQLIVDNIFYHKTCFRCCTCKTVLNAGNYTSSKKNK
jgi:hypothetical protein